MSPREYSGQKQFVIRLKDEERTRVDNAIDYIIQTDGLTGTRAKQRALVLICDRALLGFSPTSTPGEDLRVLESVNCPYLRRELDDWVCDETIGTTNKRESAILGDDNEVVIAKCQAHLLRKQELKNEKIETLLAKSSLVKMKEFFRQFLRVAKDGLDVPLYMCRASWMDGSILVSKDGVSLRCSLTDNQIVSISGVCRERVDPETGSTPCRYFLDLSHTVTLDSVDDLRKKVDIQIAPLPCPKYPNSCPGAGDCTENPESLAVNGRYCPETYPRNAPALLESLKTEDPPQ